MNFTVEKKREGKFEPISSNFKTWDQAFDFMDRQIEAEMEKFGYIWAQAREFYRIVEK